MCGISFGNGISMCRSGRTTRFSKRATYESITHGPTQRASYAAHASCCASLSCGPQATEPRTLETDIPTFAPRSKRISCSRNPVSQTCAARKKSISSVRAFLRRSERIGCVGMRNFLGAFGHVAMDYIVSLRRLPTPNTSIEILDRERYFGGTAGNLARAAARLGVKVSLASFVGADFPADYRDALKKDGVDSPQGSRLRRTTPARPS